ncbi:MAG: MBOAT family protein [Cytophagaceae bacterium]|jgi:D-alanyl-lipoteichoic acid acyltransferase DltB (MBOAT superfamily)|nr:MBOAT family protein [Cytophagaceae bacterium]
MLFNSVAFILFFPAVVIFYFLLPHKYRWLWLLLASCYFYMFFIPAYILILFLTIVIDYYAGIYIEAAKDSRKKLLLFISIFANVGILCVFKYYNFLADNITYLGALFSAPVNVPHWDIILPIGLSFHTFQAMSYTIEVYRGNQKAERHLGIYALYVLFFPQLVAGPIERPMNILHQFYQNVHFDYTRIVSGLRIMLLGFFMKLVVADRLALVVDSVYNNLSQYQGATIFVATTFFSIQIYCDFAGYSLIALGSARVLGFELMVNFKKPYFSASISDFWKRWHISLSGWFRDYVYIPLGGNKVSFSRWQFNIFVVFVISGLWHGASWNFVIWGLLHGVFQLSENVYKKYFPRWHEKKWLGKRFMGVVFTFLLVSFAWIFFRADTFDNALMAVTKMITNWGVLQIGVDPTHFYYSIIAILSLICIEMMQEYFPDTTAKLQKNTALLYAKDASMLVAILLLGVFDSSQFIYFQF